MLIVLHSDQLRQIHAGVYICHISLASIPSPLCICLLAYTEQTLTGTHTHTHRERERDVQDYFGFKDACYGRHTELVESFWLAETLSSRPLAVQWGKTLCEQKVHGVFCSLIRIPWGWTGRR